MFRYGFELEGFYQDGETIGLPPSDWPTDGFPGLLEFRTIGHSSLDEAWFNLMREICKYDLTKLNFHTNEHIFSAEQKRNLRKLHTTTKESCDVQNLYGKKPRALGNKTIASLQINISNLVSFSYVKDSVKIPEQFAPLDLGKIVKNLDKEFKEEILLSGRQLGEYAIKGDRLEYRSLPNTVAPLEVKDFSKFLSRIKKTVES